MPLQHPTQRKKQMLKCRLEVCLGCAPEDIFFDLRFVLLGLVWFRGLGCGGLWGSRGLGV